MVRNRPRLLRSAALVGQIDGYKANSTTAASSSTRGGAAAGVWPGSAWHVSGGWRGRWIWETQARAHDFERRSSLRGRAGALASSWLSGELARAAASLELACVGAPAGGPLPREHARSEAPRGWPPPQGPRLRQRSRERPFAG
jgi:hypothetical protein